MPNRTLTCIPTPNRINARPSLSLSLEGINSDKNKWLQRAIWAHLITEKKGKKGPKRCTKGVIRVYGLDDNLDVIIVEVRMTNGLYKTAGRVHRIVQELLAEELELDRTALRPNAGRGKLSRAAEEIHRKPAAI